MATKGKTSAVASKLPDLYQLLNLDPLEQDRGRIEAALKRVIAKIKAVSASDPKQAARLTKILELGKANLLSEERKAAYDARWQSAFGQDGRQQDAQSKQGEKSAEWDYRTLDGLLPSGDPDQSFDLGEFLQIAATLPESHIETDFRKLQSLLTGIETPESEPAPQVASVPVTAAMLESPSQKPLAQAVAAPNVRAAAPAASSVTKRKPKSLAKELRRKRDRSLLLSIAGVLVSLAVVLGVVFVLLAPAKPEPTVPENNVAMNAQPAQPNRNAQPEKPRGSGLPKVAGLENLGGMSPDGTGQPPQTPMSDPPAAEPDASPAPDAMSANNEPMSPTNNEPPSASMPADPEPSPATMPEPPLSDSEKAEWLKKMSEIRQLIAQQDFDSARNQIVEAEPLVKTSIQKDQYGRLDILLNLASDFHEALLEAIDGLGPGETFKVKSTDVSFVDGTSEKISIRMRGTNQSYPLTEIPVGLAYGLVDLKLDILHGSTLARKAAFAIVHPKSNDLVLQQARRWMDEAIETGFAPSDMAKVFDDDYRL